MSKGLKVFITYAHKNSEAKDKLITYLAVMKRQGLISIWHDNEILGGDKWREEIFSTNLPNSDILLYLVSADSLASENCNKELATALDEKIKVIPIILEACDWENDKLSDIQAFPQGIKPINEWTPESKGWQSVVKGVRKVVDKMHAQAKPSFESAQNKRLSEWIFQQGNFLLMLRQTGRAIEAYSYAIDINPCHASAYNNRGNAYDEKDDFDQALQDYNKAIELQPEYAKAYNNRGVTYGKKGDLDAAIKDFNEAIELDPEYASPYSNRGYAYEMKGDLDAAIKDLNKAIELQPEYAEAYNNRGVTYGKKGDFDTSIKDLNKAIELQPEYAKAYAYRGKVWLHLRDWEKAKADLITAKDMGFDIVASFHNECGSFEDFEAKNDVKLPEDIAALLSRD